MIGVSVIGALALLVGSLTAGESACAMTRESARELSCVVEGEGLLPPEIGGKAAVCAAILDAALPVLGHAGIAPDSVAVTVTITSKSTMSAVARVGGKALPQQNVGISDRPLNARAVAMLAQAVASGLAKSHD